MTPPPTLLPAPGGVCSRESKNGGKSYYVARGCGVETVYGYSRRGYFVVSRRQYSER